MRRLNRVARQGFTLVEMLVAVGLVMLMMVMFAEVFSIATKSMSKQRGVAENDQKARMLNVLIRGDLATMSYLQADAFKEKGIRALGSVDGKSSNSSKLSPYVQGYFFIAENNVNDQTDDVLQFTINTNNEIDTSTGATDVYGEELLYGRALQLGWDNNPYNPPGDTSLRDLLIHNPNQPVFDDQAGRYNTGSLTSDQTGSSHYAEVAYFVRNGNLYRRMFLIREPADPSAIDDQPKRPDGSQLIPAATMYGSGLIWNPSNPAGSDNQLSTGSFWGDFDYSATWNGGVKFFGTVGGSLDNLGTNTASLGLPQNRFGFQPNLTGLPGAFASRAITHTADGNYIGRFTHLETSDANFGWPGNPGFGADNQPYTADDTNPLTSQNTTSPNGALVINGTNLNGARVSQDILLQNVHEFDVKVWDPGAVNPITGFNGHFVDLGSGGGFFNSSSNANYGSGSTTGNPFTNVYDTWTADTTNVSGGAPFKLVPSGVGADGKPGVAGVDDDLQHGTDDPGETGWPGSDDLLYLRAITIHIRYYDISSGSTRDLTILHAFVK